MMKKQNFKKKGISLIVLVITIIVIIILAVAVILSIANNNPIENAQKAAFLNDMSVLKDELNLYTQKKLVDSNGTYKVSSLSATEDSLFENDEKQEGKTIKDVLPSLKDKYIDKIEINSGKLEYDYASIDDMKEYSWAKEALEGIKANYDKVTSTNENNIKIENAISGKIGSFRIYGNSVQEGTPTPENPVEIESVGDLVTDISDTNYGKYKIPISVTSKNLFNMKECINEVTIIDNGDGSLLVNKYGTYTGKKLYQIAPDLKVGDEFTFSINTTGNPIIYLLNSSVNFKIFLRNKEMYVATQDMLDSDVYLYKQSSGQGGNDAIIKSIQIELGDKATEYEPYLASTTTNIYLDEPLRKIGNYVDYIDFENNKVVRNVKQQIFSTSDVNEASYGKRFNFWSSIIPVGYGYVISNKFKGYSSWTYDDNPTLPNAYQIQSNPSANLISICTTDEALAAMNHNEFNNWCKSNNVIINYAITNSEEKEINLPDIQTLNGTSVITINTTTQPSQMEAIYRK